MGNHNGEMTSNVSEKVMGKSSKTKREAILESIRLRKEGSSGKVSNVWYVSLDGKMFKACMEESKDESAKGIHLEVVTVQASTGPLSGEELEDHVSVKGTPHKQ